MLFNATDSRKLDPFRITQHLQTFNIYIFRGKQATFKKTLVILKFAEMFWAIIVSSINRKKNRKKKKKDLMPVYIQIKFSYYLRCKSLNFGSNHLWINI